ncbi:TerB family tellurite resistance protein [Halosquirtibacter xylanolyticus]|uniref:tellurite resistance TerB family protein n=1 Tax=Halosquirtibacter xylanolyticus TaxID=3374599 RepID=UPI0037496719|nr:TerB family tellurite resistance protein [Prolixibacteraceae bacterium]
MSIFKSLLAGGLGWALGGPIGAIIGLAASSYLSSLTENKDENINTDRPNNYEVSLLVLIAAVMKADNRILRSELDYVKTFLNQSFGPAKAKELLVLLKDILDKDIPVNDVCHQINLYVNREGRIQMIHFLFGLALSDGEISPEEERLISQIAYEFDLNTQEFQSIKSMFIQDAQWAYKVLEVSESVSDKEVHKAFKKMAIKYHPDKVADQGDDIVKAANEKFQKLNEAYQAIKKERNL